jgi:excinuclease ABC subunit A
MHSPGFFPKGYLCKPFNGGYYFLQALALKYGFDPASTPWNEMGETAKEAFLFGEEEPLEVHYENRKGLKQTSMRSFPGFYGWIRDWDSGGTYTNTEPCPSCGGARLRKEYLEVRLAGLTIHDWRNMPLKRIHDTLEKVAGSSKDAVRIAGGAIRTGLSRSGFLESVGLGYLVLDQPASSLSAGEAQRLRLAGLLGGEMSSLTVILDEPSRGMHPVEVDGLIGALKSLRDQGNTVIAIEHELDLIRAADFLVELGPGPGRHGGRVEFAGAPRAIGRSTATGRWLREKPQTGIGKDLESSVTRRPSAWAKVTGASGNNLRNITVEIPLGVLTGVCGVSGSGKSTLVVDTIGRALAPKKHTTSVASEPLEPNPFDTITGFPSSCSIVDQTKTGLINPAGYLGVDAVFRRLYANSEISHSSGLDVKAFTRSCTACGGKGYTRTDLAFLPAMVVPCELCGETGYSSETLGVQVRGLNIAELFGKTIDEVLEIWGYEEKVRRPLERAVSVGLGYLLLRQPGYALSGGESQRLKIAKELGGKEGRRALYIFDEPTVGLHMEDLAKLLVALRTLTGRGNTVIVVEHHAGLLAACDWIIELGPGGGPEGGNLIASGSPAELSNRDTPTAKFLRRALQEALLDSRS